MRPIVRAAWAALSAACLALAAVAPAHADEAPRGASTREDAVSDALRIDRAAAPDPSRAADLRVATFNASLFRGEPGGLVEDLESPNNSQAQAVAEIVQRTRPDVLLLNEFDYDEGHRAAALFREYYLERGQGGRPPVEYPYVYTAPSNTGIPMGADLDRDGSVGGPNDSFGYGEFPGQYGMVLYSRYPIDRDAVRTFQTFRWKDMPGNLMPADYYGPLVSNVFRLSSKSHWDVPVRVGGRAVHLLASHPTPPAFDGPERRNARRNHDEIRFWADYVAGGERAEYIYDDAGGRGGLRPGADFVVLGDLNADPAAGASVDGAVGQLLGHPRIADPRPASAGALGGLAGFGGALDPDAALPATRGARALRTADFGDRGPLRVDYVLPSRSLDVLDAGVFWPRRGEDGAGLVAMDPPRSSDHRLVWVDVRVAAAGGPRGD